ncbi:uncharacterized protein LOC122198307 [Lactuca sativa]|uniref:uncharacterized protein LOC122198307 n=1 Tax=Lactuca sativa TaxID=4236 RepID=UPI001C68EBCC|nr:uncharacterized protein LOC122198307 [Lactuca sativa]
MTSTSALRTSPPPPPHKQFLLHLSLLLTQEGSLKSEDSGRCRRHDSALALCHLSLVLRNRSIPVKLIKVSSVIVGSRKNDCTHSSAAMKILQYYISLILTSVI